MSAGAIAWQMSREEYERMLPPLTDGAALGSDRWCAEDVAPEPDPTGRAPIDYSAITRDVS